MFFRMVYKSGQVFLPFCHNTRCDRRTDRQTDRQTDRNLITIPRLHYMQRGKNWWLPSKTISNPGNLADDSDNNRNDQEKSSDDDYCYDYRWIYTGQRTWLDNEHSKFILCHTCDSSITRNSQLCRTARGRILINHERLPKLVQKTNKQLSCSRPTQSAS